MLAKLICISRHSFLHNKLKTIFKQKKMISVLHFSCSGKGYTYCTECLGGGVLACEGCCGYGEECEDCGETGVAA